MKSGYYYYYLSK